MKKYIPLVVLFFVFTVSCTSSLLYETINTNNIMPSVDDKPEVDSFSTDKHIIISWPEDKGADEYILYRAHSPNAAYSEVYRGKELKYRDYVGAFEAGKFFYYKLAKKRESVETALSGFSYGVAAQMSNDVWEDNNDENNIKCIDGNITVYGTMWIYRDQYGNALVDHDYYSVSVEPGMYILLKLNFENKPYGISWDNYVYLFSSFSDISGDTITESVAFKLSNTFNERRKLSFRLQLNTADILGTPDAAGMECIAYSILNKGTQPIVPQN